MCQSLCPRIFEAPASRPAVLSSGAPASGSRSTAIRPERIIRCHRRSREALTARSARSVQRHWHRWPTGPGLGRPLQWQPADGLPGAKAIIQSMVDVLPVPACAVPVLAATCHAEGKMPCAVPLGSTRHPASGSKLPKRSEATWPGARLSAGTSGRRCPWGRGSSP